MKFKIRKYWIIFKTIIKTNGKFDHKIGLEFKYMESILY